MKWFKPKPLPLRDAVADAAEAAKDDQIADAERDLSEAVQSANQQRGELNLVLRATRLLHRRIMAAGDVLEQGTKQALRGRDDG